MPSKYLFIHVIRSIIKILLSLEDKVGVPIECLNLIGLFADLCGRISEKQKTNKTSYFMEKESNGSY